MATLDKVRIIVVGDSANNEALVSPGWTIGCSVEVKLHEYKAGTAAQQAFFIELFDIGGSISHKNTRGVFYNPTNGIILVHDLSNRKSHENLQRWLYEIINKDGKDINRTNGYDNEIDPEFFFGSTQLKSFQIPILVIGTKADMVDDKERIKELNRSGNIAEQCGADVICLNCHETRGLAPGSTNLNKLNRFFDKVIERKFYSKGETSGADKRKFTTQYSTSPPPYAPSNRIAPDSLI